MAVQRKSVHQVVADIGYAALCQESLLADGVHHGLAGAGHLSHGPCFPVEGRQDDAPLLRFLLAHPQVAALNHGQDHRAGEAPGARGVLPFGINQHQAVLLPMLGQVRRVVAQGGGVVVSLLALLGPGKLHRHCGCIRRQLHRGERAFRMQKRSQYQRSVAFVQGVSLPHHKAAAAQHP